MARLRAKWHGRAGDRRHAGETAVEVNGTRYSRYRAIDRHGDLVEALLCDKRDMAAARRFFTQALDVAGHAPEQVTTDEHDAYPRAIRETLRQVPASRLVARDHAPLNRQLLDVAIAQREPDI